MTKSLSLVALIILCAGSISAATVFAESNIFTIAEATLPVELSSFTAVQSATDCVTLTWITHSETGLLGYQVFRSDADNLSSAIRISAQLIPATNTSTTQVYSFADTEVEMNHNYYYWLESICTNGISSFAGPLIITIGDHDVPDIPGITIPTRLHYAFPNPFNPNTNLRYSVKEPATVNISIHNLKGQLIRNWEVTHPQKGYYQISWDGKDYNGNLVGGGVYLYKMDCGSYHSSKKVVLMK